MLTEERAYAASWRPTRGMTMLDLALVALGLGFFVVAALYTLACARL